VDTISNTDQTDVAKVSDGRTDPVILAWEFGERVADAQETMLAWHQAAYAGADKADVALALGKLFVAAREALRAAGAVLHDAAPSVDEMVERLRGAGYGDAEMASLINTGLSVFRVDPFVVYDWIHEPYQHAEVAAMGFTRTFPPCANNLLISWEQEVDGVRFVALTKRYPPPSLHAKTPHAS
jgi:hypothetical protein